jgi:pimeloyl-ACP methyl ester carboxylesterase
MMAIGPESSSEDRDKAARGLEGARKGPPSADQAGRDGYWNVTSEPGREPNVRKRALTVARGDGDVPAVMWLPERPARRGPLVLLGHGGGMHKESPLIDRLGTWLAVGHGIACLAIDLPFHGERTPPEEMGMSALERRRRLGLDAWRERNAGATGQAVADWRAAIDAARDADADADAVQDAGSAAPGPVGYFGVSMGTRFGVPLIGAEPRISVAVLGLFGIPPAGTGPAADAVPATDTGLGARIGPAADTESAFARAARQVTVPVLFLQQWDDELFPRNDALALFDLLGSPDKTLHANPGGHLGIPRAEFGGAVRFLARHLGSGGSDDRDDGGDSTGLLRPAAAFARRGAMG